MTAEAPAAIKPALVQATLDFFHDVNDKLPEGEVRNAVLDALPNIKGAPVDKGVNASLIALGKFIETMQPTGAERANKPLIDRLMGNEINIPAILGEIALAPVDELLPKARMLKTALSVNGKPVFAEIDRALQEIVDGKPGEGNEEGHARKLPKKPKKSHGPKKRGKQHNNDDDRPPIDERAIIESAYMDDIAGLDNEVRDGAKQYNEYMGANKDEEEIKKEAKEWDEDWEVDDRAIRRSAALPLSGKEPVPCHPEPEEVQAYINLGQKIIGAFNAKLAELTGKEVVAKTGGRD